MPDFTGAKDHTATDMSLGYNATVTVKHNGVFNGSFTSSATGSDVMLADDMTVQSISAANGKSVSVAGNKGIAMAGGVFLKAGGTEVATPDGLVR